MGIFRPNIDKLVETGNVDGILKLLYHKKGDIRLQAFLVLAKYREDRIINEIKKMLNDSDPKVRAIATLKFGELKEPGIIENLRGIIISGAQRDKIEALRILAGRGKTQDSDISNLLNLALNDKKVMVRIEAVRTMGAIKDKYSIKHLIESLDNKTYQMRLQAAKSLGEIGDESSVYPLIGALVDNHIDVRREAQSALKRIGTEKALKALNDAPFMLLVKRMTEGEFIRRETIRQIGQLKIREGIPLIKKACFDEFKNVRIEAARALGLFREKSAIDNILKLLDDTYYDVRLEAVQALEKIFDIRSLKALEKSLKDKNHNVRDAAKAAYYSLKNRLEKISPTEE